jgi:hypothetical protein
MSKFDWVDFIFQLLQPISRLNSHPPQNLSPLDVRPKKSMWRNRAEIEPGPGAHFYRGSGNGRILGALLGVPPIPTQGLPKRGKRSDLITSMCLLILSRKALHLTVFIVFTSRGLISADIQLKLCQTIQNIHQTSPSKFHASVVIAYCFMSPR